MKTHHFPSVSLEVWSKDGARKLVDNPELQDAELFIYWALQLITSELERAQRAKDHQVFEGQKRIFEVEEGSENSCIKLTSIGLHQLLTGDEQLAPGARRDIIFHSGTASTLRLTSKMIKSVMSSQSSFSEWTPFQHLHITVPETRPKLTGVQVARTLFEVITAAQEEPSSNQRFTFATPRPERPLSDPTWSPMESTLEASTPQKNMCTLEVRAR